MTAIDLLWVPWLDTRVWAIIQRDGPNHLGLRYNALPGHQMALIASGCAGPPGTTIAGMDVEALGNMTGKSRPTAAVPMENPTAAVG